MTFNITRTLDCESGRLNIDVVGLTCVREQKLRRRSAAVRVQTWRMTWDFRGRTWTRCVKQSVNSTTFSRLLCHV